MNDPLAALKPLHVPPPISWWPPAPGWWLLALLLVLVALLLRWWWQGGALQRAALRELSLLESGSGCPQRQAAAVNRLLKRYVLVCWPDPNAGSLTGEAWLEFLDTNGGDGAFSRGPGRALLTLPYACEDPSTVTMPPASSLIRLARRWIKVNRPGRQTKI